MIAKTLIAASTKPLVLSILTRGKNYGYRIIKEVEALSDGDLQWTDAMLYPVLKRMEKEQLITAQWVQTDSGRKRKYYEITATGRERLAEHQRQWISVNRVLERLWSTPPATDLITD